MRTWHCQGLAGVGSGSRAAPPQPRALLPAPRLQCARVRPRAQGSPRPRGWHTAGGDQSRDRGALGTSPAPPELAEDQTGVLVAALIAVSPHGCAWRLRPLLSQGWGPRGDSREQDPRSPSCPRPPQAPAAPLSLLFAPVSPPAVPCRCLLSPAEGAAWQRLELAAAEGQEMAGGTHTHTRHPLRLRHLGWELRGEQRVGEGLGMAAIPHPKPQPHPDGVHPSGSPTPLHPPPRPRSRPHLSPCGGQILLWGGFGQPHRLGEDGSGCRAEAWGSVMGSYGVLWGVGTA